MKTAGSSSYVRCTMTDHRPRGLWMWCMVSWAGACGGATTAASDAATQDPPSVVPTIAAPQVPAAASVVVDPPTPAPAAVWLSTLGELRLGMRPGLSSGSAPSTPEAVTRSFERAGGALDCATPVWISDESGVLDGHCEGTLPIGGQETAVTATFRRFEIPGEDGTPGLLALEAQGPFLGDPALSSWVASTRAQIEAVHGAPRGDAAYARWFLADRYVLLHDARQAPCGGLCRAYLWIGGAEHPQLVPRGFDGSAGASKP